MTAQRQTEEEAPVELTDDGTMHEEESELTQRNLRWLFWNGLRRFIVQLSNLVVRAIELYLPSGLLLCIFIVAIDQVMNEDYFVRSAVSVVSCRDMHDS